MGTAGWVAVVVGGWYVFWSLASFAAYGVDKLAARRGWLRIRERRLHEFDLLGGWPGGWAGQRAFRHKLQKASFMRWFWVAAALHGLLWVAAAILIVRFGGEG